MGFAVNIFLRANRESSTYSMTLKGISEIESHLRLKNINDVARKGEIEHLFIDSLENKPNLSITI